MNIQNINVSIAAELLESVISGHLTPEAALLKWPDIDQETDSLIKSAWHDLYHYSVDLDIRCKDPSYAEYQHNLLRDHLIELRSRLKSE